MSAVPPGWERQGVRALCDIRHQGSTNWSPAPALTGFFAPAVSCCCCKRMRGSAGTHTKSMSRCFETEQKLPPKNTRHHLSQEEQFSNY